ncbi:MAG: 50S ribosome-binding GTPase [Dehalococcoidales bacterium]|nr:50S ribosome-binding GTPase [Dehalococcoidales bacterium]
MPANLPPQYYEAEKTFRAAKSPEEKIAILEEMMAIMPKHKGTDHLRAELRSRISKLTQLAAKKTGARRASMIIEKEGAAQLVVIGPPNTGKSQLVASITNASPAIAEYPFTTQTATPGMMKFENIQIQLIDTPPLLSSIEWWLRHMLIRADALLIVLDLSDNPLTQMEEIITLLENSRIGILPNKHTDPEVILYQKKAIIIGNKLDLENANINYPVLKSKYGDQLPVIATSSQGETGLDGLKHGIYHMLDIIRVYTKTPRQKADFNDPIILKQGSTLEEAATEIHKDFGKNLKFARIWGSGKHDGIMAKRDHILQDGDLIELHM